MQVLPKIPDQSTSWQLINQSAYPNLAPPRYGYPFVILQVLLTWGRKDPTIEPGSCIQPVKEAILELLSSVQKMKQPPTFELGSNSWLRLISRRWVGNFQSQASCTHRCLQPTPSKHARMALAQKMKQPQGSEVFCLNYFHHGSAMPRTPRAPTL